jgi:hypothetical protein
MPVNFYIILFIIDNCENFYRSLFWVLDFQEWMRVLESSLTFLTKIKVWANRAFITRASYISLMAVITSNSFMNNYSFFSFFNYRLFYFFFFEMFRNNFFVWNVLSYERLIGNSRSLGELFRNLGLNFRNYLWKHLLQSLLN